MTRFLSFLAFICLFAPHRSWSVETLALATTQAHSTAQLVLDQKTYRSGEKILAGITIDFEEHWHTYWKNPGDSGAPVSFEWKLPAGWNAGALKFQNPTRIPTPPLETFGYEDSALFYAELTAPANASGAADIELEAEWLVCKDVCIPAVYTFNIKLLPSPDLQPSADARLFQKVKSLEALSTPEIFGFFDISGQDVNVSIEGPAGLKLKDVFPFPKNLLSNKPIAADNEILKDQKQKWSFTTPISRLADKAESREILVLFEDPTGKAQWAQLELKEQKTNLWSFLFFAFIGGLLLNLMPCVFPILSMKFFALLKHSGGGHRELKKANALYVAGVLTSFWVLAFALFSLREGGEALGWGFQLQSPGFVIFLILLFVLMAFNFLGWFELQFNGAGMNKLLRKDGPSGHFLTGVLSTIVASPCTAPFMGVSIGFALAQPLSIMLLIFTSLGLGLSFPYIALSFFPKAMAILPRPGAWMEKLKTFMAFPLLATVIWLTWSLSFQVSATTLAFVWTGILLLGFMVWVGQNLFGHAPLSSKLARVFIFLIVIWLSFFNISKNSANTLNNEGGEIAWQKFSPELVAKLQQQGSAVFIDFTAAWCITCQVNKQVTFTDASVIELIKSSNTQMLLADWTNRDPVISKILDQYGRAGVPLYLYYPAGTSSSAVILPEILTPSIFKKNIEDHRN